MCLGTIERHLMRVRENMPLAPRNLRGLEDAAGYKHAIHEWRLFVRPPIEWPGVWVGEDLAEDG